jgi:potassium efflux system protein
LADAGPASGTGHSNPENALVGITGANFFDADGEGKKPVFIGIYNGTNVISALTQLQPIKSEGARNYIDELKRGRMLYVNDRFMYKTNVVYTGLQINEIAGLDVEKNQYDLDFLIWFRYRGQFEPQDLEFVNAVEPIKLTTPAEERQVGDMTYRLYRVKGKFRYNFTETRRPYGQHVVGVGFTHRLLNKNNLQYVVDVLGLALDRGETVKDKLEARQALNPATGWIIERAWNSQDIIAKGTMGDPAYVGFGATDPDFSQIDLGMVIKRGEFNARDFVPTEFFIYVGIFALIGTIFAVGMDRRERGRFWAAQSWFLRVISWPLLLLSGGNLAIDLAFQNLADHYIDIMILVYDSLWWLVPARLIGLAVERFLWTPLEDHTERNIPNVIRVFASVTVYTFAICGIIAFVFDQTLTSILASTGLLAMIIGLAIQANISNIFSGIVINMERPFNVGDWVQIGDLDEGRVVDITWRTVRVKVRNGYVISVPNGQVSEAQIHNFNSFNAVRVELPLYLDAKYPLLESAEIMEEGLAAAPHILDSPEREVRFKGVERHPGAWVSVYEIQFWLDNYGRREEIAEGALSHVWDALMARGIYPADRPDPAVLAAIGAAVGQDEAEAPASDDGGDGGGDEEEYELEFEDN